MNYFSSFIHGMNKKIFFNSIDSIKMAYDYTNRPDIFIEIINNDFNHLFRTIDILDFKIKILDLYCKYQQVETFSFPTKIFSTSLISLKNEKDKEEFKNKRNLINSYFLYQYAISILTSLNIISVLVILIKARFSGKLLKYQISKNYSNLQLKVFSLMIFTGFLQISGSHKFQNIMFKFEFKENELRKYKEFRKFIKNINI